MNVRLSKEQKIKILNTKDVYAIMQQILLRENKIRRNQEHFWIIGLNNAHKILFIELLSLGAVNRVTIAAPEVFRMAIYKLAVKTILVHNHPSGTLIPSEADLDFTDRMLKAGTFLDIEVIDHHIISETDYVSFADMGFIDKFKTNGAYEIVNRLDAKLEQEKIKKERNLAVKNRNIELAKKMLAKGDSLDTIRDYTGLTIRELNKVVKGLGGGN